MKLESTQIMEIIFDIAYLITIWTVVVKMKLRYSKANMDDVPIARRLMAGFFLLALGDTGHVGFRVLAYVLGSLETKLTFAGFEIPLVGAGAVCTAYTVTILYMLIVDTWRVRFAKKVSVLYILLQTAALARLVIMAFPQNEWPSAVPPFDWSMYRNMPLTFVGLVIAAMLLVDATKAKDKTFRNFAYFIFASFLFYLPVILFVQAVPMIGMLMMPKTVAYLLMAFAAYVRFFKKAATIYTGIGA